MTDIPQAAPRSEDGQWWWDGAQWQPVAAATPAAAAAAAPQDAAPDAAASAATQAAAPATAAAAPAAGGQLSEDGQWQWDGSAWQPAAQGAAQAGAMTGAPTQPGAQAGGAAQAADPVPAAAAAPKMGDVTVAKPDLELLTLADGTTGVSVVYTVTNSGTSAIAAGVLTPKVIAASDHSAEGVASVDGRPFDAFAVGEAQQKIAEIQIDPGAWSVFVQVVNASGDSMGMSDGVSITVPGQVAVAQTFDDQQSYALSVTIELVEHLSENFFRVHYILQNNSERELPAGMRVIGQLGGEASEQYYTMTSSLAAHQQHNHYLTLEALYPNKVTATIIVDKEGPSQVTDTVQVDIAEDGTPTMSL